MQSAGWLVPIVAALIASGVGPMAVVERLPMLRPRELAQAA
jgi:hypothetical protein